MATGPPLRTPAACSCWPVSPGSSRLPANARIFGRTPFAVSLVIRSPTVLVGDTVTVTGSDLSTILTVRGNSASGAADAAGAAATAAAAVAGGGWRESLSAASSASSALDICTALLNSALLLSLLLPSACLCAHNPRSPPQSSRAQAAHVGCADTTPNPRSVRDVLFTQLFVGPPSVPSPSCTGAHTGGRTRQAAVSVFFMSHSIFSNHVTCDM